MTNTKNLAMSAILFALGIVLPFITMQIPTIGVMLSPLHFPILIAGFVVGPINALILGLILPIFRGLIFQIPRFPTAIFMTVELGIYGLVSGLLFNKLFKKKFTFFNIYTSIIIAMVLGRVGFGIVKYIAFKYILDMSAYSIAIWISDVFISSVPGIIIQLIIIPTLVMTLHKRGDI